MKIANSLSRQIILSMSAVVLCVIALALVGSYVFYALLWVFWPPSDLDMDEWLPSGMEWAWMALITCISLAVGAVVAIKLSRRILMPLNSVAASLRRLADGDLDARATASDRSLAEATLLVDDFNSMAIRLKRMAEEQSFWNAAIAHELRTPLTILRGRLQGLAEGVFTPDQAQFYSLLNQVEGLTRLIEATSKSISKVPTWPRKSRQTPVCSNRACRPAGSCCIWICSNGRSGAIRPGSARRCWPCWTT